MTYKTTVQNDSTKRQYKTLKTSMQRVTRSVLYACIAYLLGVLTLPAQTHPYINKFFPDAPNYGDGNYGGDNYWFRWIYADITTPDWIFHQEHGFLHIEGPDNTNMWIYDQILNEWLWTTKTYYTSGFLWHSSKDWLWYDSPLEYPRYFYAGTTEYTDYSRLTKNLNYWNSYNLSNCQYQCSTWLLTDGGQQCRNALWFQGVAVSNNCYNYATNVRNNKFSQPGWASGYYFGANMNLVKNAALNDGIEEGSKNGFLPPNKVRTALVISSNDYHWYRQGNDGSWTHKPGAGYATDKDNSNQLIYNPETANRGPYTTFVGYFFVDSNNSEGSGMEIITGPCDGTCYLYYQNCTPSLLAKQDVKQEITRQENYTAIMHVYSGRLDPVYRINKSDLDMIYNLIEQSYKVNDKDMKALDIFESYLGYRGMTIYDTDKEIILQVSEKYIKVIGKSSFVCERSNNTDIENRIIDTAFRYPEYLNNEEINVVDIIQEYVNYKYENK